MVLVLKSCLSHKVVRCAAGWAWYRRAAKRLRDGMVSWLRFYHAGTRRLGRCATVTVVACSFAACLARLASTQQQPLLLLPYFARWVSWERMRSYKLAFQSATLARASQCTAKRTAPAFVRERRVVPLLGVAGGLLLRVSHPIAQGAAAFARGRLLAVGARKSTRCAIMFLGECYMWSCLLSQCVRVY